MKIVSLTRDILNGVYYKNRAMLRLESTTKHGVTESSFSTTSIHIGTHIDMASHFGGDVLAISPLVFTKSQVCVISNNVSLLDLQYSDLIRMVIFDFDQESFREESNYAFEFSSPTIEEVTRLVEIFPNIECIATTNLSIGSPSNKIENQRVHNYLLNQVGLVVLEDIIMSNFKSEFSLLIVHPIMLGQAEAAFAAVSLICH